MRVRVLPYSTRFGSSPAFLKYISRLICPIFKLTMPDGHVEANIAAVIKAACAHRSAALGPFINRFVVSKDYFFQIL